MEKEILYERLLERYNLLCNIQRKGKRLVGESTPAYIFYLDLIDKLYPNIKKICIVRDPKDRIVSMHNNNILKKRTTDSSISDAFVKKYCIERINMEYLYLMNYVGTIFCTTYEKMTADPTDVASKCFQFLEVFDSEEIALKSVEEASFENMTAREYSGISRRKGIESKDSGLWRGIVGSGREYLSTEQCNLIDKYVSVLHKKVYDRFDLFSEFNS